MLQEALYRTMRAVIKIYARLKFDLDVVEHETLPEGPKILAPNHPATSDPFLIALLASGEPRILIDETLFKVPGFGTLLRWMRHVPVIKGHGRLAYETAKWLLATGHTVIVFPEGCVSPIEGGFCPPRTGVVRLALETGVPVIPVGIHIDRQRIRTIETQVAGRGELGLWYFGGPYAMTVGESLRLEGDVKDWAQVRRLTEGLMERIGHLVDESICRVERTALKGKLESGLPCFEIGKVSR
ncbi:MAG: lysophospholipid acyltransferase family protein [Anaerolineales bacterium]